MANVVPLWASALLDQLQFQPYQALQAMCRHRGARGKFEQLGLRDPEWLSCLSDTTNCHAGMMNKIRQVVSELPFENSAQAAMHVVLARQEDLIKALEELQVEALQAICRSAGTRGKFDMLGLSDQEWRNCYSTTKSKMINDIRGRIDEHVSEWATLDLVECVKSLEQHAKEKGVTRKDVASAFALVNTVPCDDVLDRALRNQYVVLHRSGALALPNNANVGHGADTLVACIGEVQRMTGMPRVRRSAVGLAYARHEADASFKAVVAHAEKMKLVIVGGNLGNAWIKLSSQGDDQAASVPGTVKTCVEILVACIGEVQRIACMNCVRRSGVGFAYARREADVSFDEAVAHAEKMNVVTVGSVRSSAWIALYSDHAAVEYGTSIDDLVGCVHVVHIATGMKRVRRSAVGIQYVRLNRDATFRNVVAAAIAHRRVAVGGELGDAWIELCDPT